MKHPESRRSASRPAGPAAPTPDQGKCDHRHHEQILDRVADGKVNSERPGARRAPLGHKDRTRGEDQ
jgi:hypothetical protein